MKKKDIAFDKIKLSNEEREFFEHRKLKDKYFIGRFNETESGYLISDIRRSDFSKIKYKPKNAKSFTIKIEGSLDEITEENRYYRFTWAMVQSKPNYVFNIDEYENIKLLDSKDIVNLLYNDIYGYPASASEKIVNTLDTLKNQLTASGKEVFIYELLQNANDYPQIIGGKKQPVDVEFYITDNYLVFQHSGDYFDAKNIAAICSINDKEKTGNTEAIGYKGIGFKTVFLDNDYVLLKTGDYSFRFDYEKTKNIDDTPWQILPIWTIDNEVDDEVLDVTNYADEKFRVQIALRPADADILHESEQNYEELFADVFETERVILFIPYINSVSVYMDDSDEPTLVRVKENDKWCVSEPKKYISNIPEKLTEELNRRIDKYDGKIPEKYYDFRKTSVRFACKRDGNKLLPVENTCLYCYLPAKKAKFGFGFLINSDMIPTGPRDNIEPKEKINHTIAKIAGQQFFYWIQDLLNSGEYDYDSVFCLIPNFEECKEKYEEDEDIVKFIEEFQEGFENELKKNTIIPVEEDGEVVLKPIDKVNYDKTGITCTRLMSDDELRILTDWKDYFPYADLRNYESNCLKPGIDAFLNTYVLDDHNFTINELLDNCENEEFQTWLTDIDNNSSFLEFLLIKNQIEEFKDKDIFITEDEELKAASQIYENIDNVYPDLETFNDFLPRLAKFTREYFAEGENWDSIKEILFRKFDADDFVDKELRSKIHINDIKQRLRDKKTSLGFFNFLAQHVGYTPAYKEFPIISFKDSVIEDFKGNLYFYHENGEELYDAEWTKKSWINLISEDYSDPAKEYFKNEFKVADFCIKTFVYDILLTNDSRKYLNELGEEHIAFVKYCYEHREYFEDKALSQYSLWTYDKDGENEHILTEDVIFFQEKNMDEYQEKVWIKNGWMYQLDEEYIEGIEDLDSFYKFLSDKFGVMKFSMKTFYQNVVAVHAKDICKSVGGSESDEDTDESIDILNYLGENYKLIFEEDGNEKFINLPLYRYDVWDAITDRDVKVYLHDEGLKTLLEAEWTPEDIAYMLEERYNAVFEKYPALRKILEVSKYTFKGFKETLFADVGLLKHCTSDKEENIAFHRYMLDNKDDLTKSDYKTLKQISLYAFDKNGEDGEHMVEDALYISNIYMESSKGLEAMVKKYDETACFTSDAYLTEDAEDIEVESWRDYFIELGVSFNIHDIVFNSILPNLYEINNKDIVSLLAGYYDDLHAVGIWDEVKKDLCKLNVLTKAGDHDFRPVKDVLFNDCYDVEPYPYIVIKNEISDSYRKSSPEVMRLLREIVNEAKSNSFKTLDEWKKKKLDWYLVLQNEGLDNVESIHTRFIQDLANDYIQNYDLYTKVKVKEILLQDKEGAFHKPKDLTEGSAYQPRCNFERFHLPLIYLSESYLPFEKSDAKAFKKLFTDMDVVYDIHKEHLPLMRKSYDFTVYFWTEYLIQYANRTHITSMGVDELNNFATIPTGNSKRKEVKKPNQLYSQSLIQNGYVKGMVRDYDDKMPLEAIFSTKEVTNDILSKLGLASSLSFNDCLDCMLHTKNKEKRQNILSWLSSKNTIDEEAVEYYLNHDNSIWRNGRGEFMRLNELFVLDINEDHLKQLFGKNAKVMSQEYIDSDYIFERFCKIFGIDALTKNDFELTPDIIKEPTTENMRKKLRLPLLIVSAVSGSNNWKEFYEGYCDKLDILEFHKCNSIILNYEEVLKDSSIQYHRDENKLFYVKDWMGRRVFKDLISDLVNYFDIDLDSNILEGIFEADDENQRGIINQYVNYELSRDKDFMKTLAGLNTNIAMGIQIADRNDEEDMVVNSSEFGNSTREESNDSDDKYFVFQTNDKENGCPSYEDNDLDSSKSETGDEIHDSNNEDNDIEEESDEVINEDSNNSEGDSIKNEKSNEYNDVEEYSDSDVDDESSLQHSESRSKNTSSNSSTRNNPRESGERPSDVVQTPRQSRNEPRPEPNGNQESRQERQSSQSRQNNDKMQKGKPVSRDKRRNYMGYDPDETKQRPFNIDKQETTTLETKEAKEEEISRLSALLGRAFDKDSIVDENYLVRMRFYNSVKNHIGDPEMTEKEFISKGHKYMQTKNGKYIHRCSARGGILYISPSIWNRVKYDNCIICMYYGKKANQFLYIHSQNELMNMIDKDAILVQVTGNDKGHFVNKVYDTQFPGMNGNIYTMIRTIKTNSDDFIFDPADTYAKNDDDFDPDLV